MQRRPLAIGDGGVIGHDQDRIGVGPQNTGQRRVGQRQRADIAVKRDRRVVEQSQLTDESF